MGYPLLDPAAGDATTRGAGGAEAQLATIGKELAKRGVDVHFIVGDHGQPARVRREGVTAHRASFAYMGGSKRHVLPAWWSIWRAMRRVAADCYLIKTPRHLLTLMGLYCLTHGARLVFVAQKDSDLDEKTIRAIGGVPAWWLYRAGLRLTDGVVAQTVAQQKAFQRVFGKESVVIGNVLSLPEAADLPKDDYVLWVGNSTSDKQPHLVPELARGLPDIRFRMIMALSASRPDDAFLRDALRHCPNVEYLGPVAFGEIAEHYRRARIFISTSKCEGFPNTFLQAWQYRTPVVSLHIDPDDVIVRHNLGRVSGTVAQMVSDIRALHDDPELRARMGENAVGYAYDHHSVATGTEKYLQFLGSRTSDA